MRVLISGISGFVGCRLAHYLSERGDEISGIYIIEPPAISGAVLHEADLLDPEAVRRAVIESDPEVIIHLAGLSHVGESWKALADYYQVNILGTDNLLRAAEGRRVVVASSAEVYGTVPESEQPIAEDRLLAPASPYALTKAAIELLSLPRNAVVVRCFNILGAGQAASFAMPAFAAQLAAIRAGHQAPVLRVGNLAARRDFVYIGDAVEGYRLLAAEGEGGQVYNLGSGEAHGIGEVLDRLVEISGVHARIEVDPERFRPVDLPLLRADSGRLRSLGWAPKVSLDDALRDLWTATLDSASRG